jgi:hypothetical protein
MRADYWDVTDAQVVEKTGKSLEHWRKVLNKMDVASMKSNAVVAHLQEVHGVPRYWARTLTTWYSNQT